MDTDPLLVAAPSVDGDVISRLQRHLLAIDREASYAILLADVLLKRFVTPDVGPYRELESQARYAIESDYEEIR